MVKGVTRQIIVVDSPDKQYFREAIFILRDGIAQEEVPSIAMEEAFRIAERCRARYAVRRRKAPPPLLWGLLGAAAMGIVWVLTTVV